MPASGPEPGSAGESTQVMTALYESAVDDGNCFDLDPGARNRKPADLDERARRARVTKELLADGIDLRPVVDVSQEDGHLGDIRKGRAARFEHRRQVGERLTRLRNDVLSTDETAFRIHRDAARHEEELADPDRVGVVADRLSLPGHPNLLARRHRAEDNRGRMEPQFVHFDNVRAFELAAGVTGRPLFGEGAMLNLIEFEPGATVPLHSHEHEQLGIILRGMQALVVDGEAHELGPLEGYVLPGGVEHSAYCGPEGALVLDVFRPVREDYRERWQSAESG